MCHILILQRVHFVMKTFPGLKALESFLCITFSFRISQENTFCNVYKEGSIHLPLAQHYGDQITSGTKPHTAYQNKDIKVYHSALCRSLSYKIGIPVHAINRELRRIKIQLVN